MSTATEIYRDGNVIWGEGVKKQFGQEEVIINNNAYTELGAFNNVVVKLPIVIGVKWCKGFVETNSEGKIIRCYPRINVSNKNQNKGRHTIAKNIYCANTEKSDSDQMTFLQDATLVPLGQQVLAKVIVKQKNHYDGKKSMIIDIYIYEDQARNPEWFYEEAVVNCRANGKSFVVPNDNKRINFNPFGL